MVLSCDSKKFEQEGGLKKKSSESSEPKRRKVLFYIWVMPLQTHTLFILWSEFTKQFLKNIFREFRDKAFLMATIFFFFFFFRETTKHKFTQLTAYFWWSTLISEEASQNLIPFICTSLQSCQSFMILIQINTFMCVCTYTHIHTHTLPQSKAGWME